MLLNRLLSEESTLTEERLHVTRNSECAWLNPVCTPTMYAALWTVLGDTGLQADFTV